MPQHMVSVWQSRALPTCLTLSHHGQEGTEEREEIPGNKPHGQMQTTRKHGQEPEIRNRSTVSILLLNPQQYTHVTLRISMLEPGTSAGGFLCWTRVETQLTFSISIRKSICNRELYHQGFFMSALLLF